MSEAGEGREDLSVIHISVPRAVKARWVKASQARGMKLTDWIVEQLERPMKTYPIPDAIASQAAQRWIASDAAGPAVRELQALGEVHVGMCSAWEFCEL